MIYFYAYFVYSPCLFIACAFKTMAVRVKLS